VLIQDEFKHWRREALAASAQQTSLGFTPTMHLPPGAAKQSDSSHFRLALFAFVFRSHCHAQEEMSRGWSSPRCFLVNRGKASLGNASPGRHQSSEAQNSAL